MNGNLLALGAVSALALGAAARRGASRGSPARRSPLDYDALADDFREFYATLGWEVDEERELRRWARGHHVTYLGAGAQRAVFGVPSGALKIAFDRDGKDANCREAEVWEDAPADIRRHLVPVLEHSGMEPGEGAWLLMERVKASARGSLPPEAAARLSACGFNDIVGQNISDDGRLLDYGWMYMDAWGNCATPGTPTSNRPAVAGSAARISHRGNAKIADPRVTWGNALRGWLGSPAARATLRPELSRKLDPWTFGGCRILAETLHRLWSGSVIVAVDAGSLDDHADVVHLLVAHAGGYWDAHGFHATEREALAWCEAICGSSDPDSLYASVSCEIVPLNPVHARGIVSSETEVKALAAAMAASLGPMCWNRGLSRRLS